MTDHSATLLYKSITDLSKISDAGIDLLFSVASVQDLVKGQVLLTQGAICKTVVFVEKGYLRTFINKDGLEINTDFTLEGSFTTNLKSLRSGSASDTTIQAGESATIYAFDKDRLLELYTLSPEIESFGRKLFGTIVNSTGRAQYCL